MKKEEIYMVNTELTVADFASFYFQIIPHLENLDVIFFFQFSP